jgi:16S rRNA (guanine527-N7)-methyltransferase
MPLLISGARRLGFELSNRQVRQFQLYFETLVDWNSRMNLTAITDLEGVQVRHFLDSLTVGAALVEELRSVPPRGFRLADIGTGAGFPGVPLKILWPQIGLTLADSVGKKTTFLKELCDVLELEGVEVCTARAEEMGQDRQHRERYNAVAARAVASLPVLCEYCLPLVKVGGRFLAPKKGDISQEVEEAKKASPILGGDSPRLHPFTLPGEEEERVVVAIKKARATPPGYPRRVGLAKSNPLGAQKS